MELFEVHTKILIPFVDEAITELRNMAHLTGKPINPTQEEVDFFTFQGYAVSVVAKVYGQIEGKILIHYHEDTALLIGNNVMSIMLGQTFAENEITQDIGDALSEFSNTLIGRATRALREKNMKISFEAPVFVIGGSDIKSIMEDVVEIFTIPIMLEDNKYICLSYLLHNKTD